jgi:hypothetical protein
VGFTFADIQAIKDKQAEQLREHMSASVAARAPAPNDKLKAGVR